MLPTLDASGIILHFTLYCLDLLLCLPSLGARGLCVGSSHVYFVPSMGPGPQKARDNCLVNECLSPWVICPWKL